MKRLLLPVALLGGCVVATTEETTSTTSSRMPTPAEQACLRDVTATTNNPDVRLLSSDAPSEAGTVVIVGVGDQAAPWRCIAYRDGTTGGIESLTDEGAA